MVPEEPYEVGMTSDIAKMAKAEFLTGSTAQGVHWFGTAFPSPNTAKDAEELMYKFKKVAEDHPGTLLNAQVEKCPDTGRFHVQWCMKFTTNWRRGALFAAVGHKFWCERPRRFEYVWDYCEKEETAVGPRVKVGELKPKRQGERTDIALLVSCIKEMASKQVNGLNVFTDDDILRECVARFPESYTKYGNRCADIIRLTRAKVFHVAPASWHKWQVDLLAKFEEPPDDRSIYFVVDVAGGAGKSTLTRELMQRGTALPLTGTINNMSHIVSQNQHCTVFIFDLSRAAAENTVHLLSMAENLKNSMLINTKYHTSVTLLKKCHVVFFCNALPPGVREPVDGKFLLSQDRPIVWNVYKDGYECITGPPTLKRQREPEAAAQPQFAEETKAMCNGCKLFIGAGAGACATGKCQ